MSEERKPAFYVVKSRQGEYMRIDGDGDEMLGGSRFDALVLHTASEALECVRRGLIRGSMLRCDRPRVVSVFVTTRKVKRGHSWAWACKRLLEGKRVRQASWNPASWLAFDNDCLRIAGAGWNPGKRSFAATDWVAE